MKKWSLKVKVGAYATLLTVVCLGATAAVILAWIHYRMLRDVDESLRENAGEIVQNIRNFRGVPVDPRRPLSAKFIPAALRDRFLVVMGPEGQILYRSPNLGEDELVAGDAELRTTELLGMPCRVGRFDHPPYQVLIATDLVAVEAAQRELRTGFLVALPVVGLLVFVGGIWLGRRAVAPVAGLTAAAEKISADRPEERLPMPPAKDEIARLTAVVNRSFDRLQQSYEAARRFSADASHQLKTPVAVLRIGLEELRRNGSLGEEDRLEVEQLMQQTRRLNALIGDLLLLAQVDAGRLQLDAVETDLAPVIDAALDDLGVLAEVRGIELEARLPDFLVAKADPRRVALVLQNLVENAVKYTPEGGRIQLATQCGDGRVRVRVGNSGPGIPGDEQDRIFERFRRGSSVGEKVRGQGLGLNIARELARAHGGELRLLQSSDGWTEFELELPAGAAIAD